MRVDLARRGGLRVVPPDELEASPEVVARDLLGAVLVRREGEETIEVRVVETEAYDQSDPASHTHRGRTPGNATMFGPPGHLYVYFTYGMHHCCNVVCGADGHGAAVLLRAAAVLAGHERVRRRRPSARGERDLANGPAKLTAALGLGRGFDGMDLSDRAGPLWLGRDGLVVPDEAVATGPRVGVRRAADRPWRYWIAGVDAVSPYRRHPRAPGA